MTITELWRSLLGRSVPGKIICVGLSYRVLAAPIRPEQLTAAKLRVLPYRYTGQEWIDSPLRHLDVVEAERTDVERAIRTYRSAGPMHEAQFQQLYADLPAEVRALGDLEALQLRRR